MAIREVVVFANITVIVIYVSLFLPQPLVVVKKKMGVKFSWFSIIKFQNPNHLTRDHNSRYLFLIIKVSN